MTPTVNTNPLAALLTDSTQTQPGAISSLATAPGAAKGANLVGEESKFFNILQLVSVQSSSEKTLVVPVGLTAEQLPVISELPLVPADLPAGQAQLLTGQAQFLAGQAQLLSAQAMRKDLLESGPSLLSDENLDLDQGLVPEISPVSLLPAVPVAASGLSGSQSPPGGNGLPGLATQAHMTRRNMSNEAGQVQMAPMGSAATAEDGLAALSLQKEPPVPVLAPAHFDRMPVPEFAAPLAKMLGSQVGSSNMPALSSANVDVSALLSEGGTNQAELTRSAASVSTSDRLSAVQQTVTTLTLPRPAGAPGWDQGLGQRILWMVDNGLNQAELRLDPPNLGSVNIRISMLDDQAQLQFQAANPAAREALESALPKLREMFNQQGLELGDADVSDQQAQSESEGDRESGHLQAELDADSRADTETNLADLSHVGHGRETLSGSDGGNVLIDEFV